MRQVNRIIFLLLPTFILLSCGENIFKEMADKTTDKAVFYSAQQDLDSRAYDNAIEKLVSLSADFKATESFKKVYAGALAGKCGLEFIPFFVNFGNIGSSGNTFFKLMMANFAGQTTYKEYCKESDSVTQSIIASGPANPTEYKLFLSVLSAAKIGVVLHEAADQDGDGVTDATFIACNDADNHGISDDDVNHIITGFGLFIQNIATLNVDASSQTVLDNLMAACTVDLSGVGLGSINPCGRTDPSTVTATERILFRALLESPDFGVNTCTSTEHDELNATTTILDCCKTLRSSLIGF